MASSLGHAKSIYNLGVYYARGLGGLPKDKNEAKKHFLIAAHLGQKEAKKALLKEQQQNGNGPMVVGLNIGPTKSSNQPTVRLPSLAVN
jgi:TPR repeat protein